MATSTVLCKIHVHVSGLTKHSAELIWCVACRRSTICSTRGSAGFTSDWKRSNSQSLDGETQMCALRLHDSAADFQAQARLLMRGYLSEAYSNHLIWKSPSYVESAGFWARFVALLSGYGFCAFCKGLHIRKFATNSSGKGFREPSHSKTILLFFGLDI